LTSDAYVLFDYEYLYVDKSHPPAEDKKEGRLWIKASNKRFTVIQLDHAVHLGSPEPWRPDPGPDPKCSARDAWKAAVKSGMAEDAKVLLAYHAERPEGPGKPYLWTFRVEGHPELER